MFKNYLLLYMLFCGNLLYAPTSDDIVQTSECSMINLEKMSDDQKDVMKEVYDYGYLPRSYPPKVLSYENRIRFVKWSNRLLANPDGCGNLYIPNYCDPNDQSLRNMEMVQEDLNQAVILVFDFYQAYEMQTIGDVREICLKAIRQMQFKDALNYHL